MAIQHEYVPPEWQAKSRFPKGEDRGFSKSSNPILEHLVKEIGKYRLLGRLELQSMFRDVDDHYQAAIRLLATHTSFLEQTVAGHLSDILSGSIGGRIIHSLPTEKHAVWGRNSDLITAGLAMLAELVDQDVEERVSTFLSLRLAGSVVFDCLTRYAELGEEYMTLSQAAIGGHPSDKMAKIAKEMQTPPTSIPLLAYNVRSAVTYVASIHKRVFAHHTRLLIKVAASLTTDSDQLLDNFQAGGFGLMRAIRDHNPPYNFIGYASSWIKQSILGHMRAVSNNIRVPGNVLQEYSALEKAKSKLPEAEQNIEGLAKHTGQDAERIKKVYEVINLAHTWSFDTEVHNNSSLKESGPVALRELIPDESTQTDHLENPHLEVASLLRDLPYRERWVVANFHGVQEHIGKSPHPPKLRFEARMRERLRQLYVGAELRQRRAARSA